MGMHKSYLEVSFEFIGSISELKMSIWSHNSDFVQVNPFLIRIYIRKTVS